MFKRNEYTVVTEDRKLLMEVSKLKSLPKRCQSVLKVIQKLGDFSTDTMILKAQEGKENFINQLYFEDSNGRKYFFTNTKSKSLNWLHNKEILDVVAEEINDNQYNLYTTTFGEPQKVGTVDLLENSVLYTHSNMVYQIYDFINGDKNIGIKVLNEQKLSEEELELLEEKELELLKAAREEQFKEELEKLKIKLSELKPSSAMEFINILSDIHDIKSYEYLEATTGKNEERIVIKNGVVQEANVKCVTDGFSQLISESNSIKINAQESDKGLTTINVVKSGTDTYKVYKCGNNQTIKFGDYLVLEGAIFSIEEPSDEKVYSYTTPERVLEMKTPRHENSYNIEKFISGLITERPTNIIEFLKVASDTKFLPNNFTAYCIENDIKTDKISEIDGKVVEYKISEDTYEQTKDKVRYETVAVNSQKVNPEAFQIRKTRKSS